MTVRAFRAHDDEAMKAITVFATAENQWKCIRGDVKEWVWQNWSRWMAEKPAWFTKDMQTSIPIDMIPSIEDQKKISAEKRSHRLRATSVHEQDDRASEMLLSGYSYKLSLSRKLSTFSTSRPMWRKGKKEYRQKVAPVSEDELEFLSRRSNVENLVTIGRISCMEF